MVTTKVNRLVFLLEEVSLLKTRLRPEDTGHIHTTINVLENTIKELKEELNNEIN
jgi:hypothetical protein